ncbi:MAG: DNA-formamidopyrimidine glycosylase family protein [Methylohalobius sp. ZOD2]
MPELPDVEVYKRYLDATALHQRIDHIHVDSPELLRDTSPQGLGRALKGKTFEFTRRHGKYLFVALAQGCY